MLRVIHLGAAAIRQRSLLTRIVILLAALLLIAGHGAFFYYIRAHMGLSAGALCGVILLVFVKHLGFRQAATKRWIRRIR